MVVGAAAAVGLRWWVRWCTVLLLLSAAEEDGGPAVAGGGGSADEGALADELGARWAACAAGDADAARAAKEAKKEAHKAAVAERQQKGAAPQLSAFWSARCSRRRRPRTLCQLSSAW